MAEAGRLKPVVGIKEQKISFFDAALDRLEPFLACLSSLHDWSTGRDHVGGEDGSGEKVRRQGPNILSAGGHDPGESVEQVGIEMPSPIGSVEIVNVIAVLVVAFVWK